MFSGPPSAIVRDASGWSPPKACARASLPKRGSSTVSGVSLDAGRTGAYGSPPTRLRSMPPSPHFLYIPGCPWTFTHSRNIHQTRNVKLGGNHEPGQSERLDPRPAWFRRMVEIRLFEEAFVVPPLVAVDVSVRHQQDATCRLIRAMTRKSGRNLVCSACSIGRGRSLRLGT